MAGPSFIHVRDSDSIVVGLFSATTATAAGVTEFNETHPIFVPSWATQDYQRDTAGVYTQTATPEDEPKTSLETNRVKIDGFDVDGQFLSFKIVGGTGIEDAIFEASDGSKSLIISTVATLDDLTDVLFDTAGAQLGQFLIFDGTDWINLIHILDDHGDVDTTTTPPVANDLLQFNGTNWVPVNDSIIPFSIDDLNDVDTTTAVPTVNDLLQWNGTNWVPVSDSIIPFSIDDLNDVDTSSTVNVPAVGEVLQWNGTMWIPASVVTDIPQTQTWTMVGGIQELGQDEDRTAAWGHEESLAGVGMFRDGEILGFAVSLEGGISSGQQEFFITLNGVQQNGSGETVVMTTGETVESNELSSPIQFSVNDILGIVATGTSYTETGSKDCTLSMWYRDR